MSQPKYFKAWFIFFLIAGIGGMFVGGFIGGILGLFLGLAHVELGTIKIICAAVGFVLGLPLSYFTYRWTVSEFIVKELNKTSPPSAPATAQPAGAAQPTT